MRTTWALCLMGLLAADAWAAPPKPFLFGGDISMVTKIEALGGVFRDKGVQDDPIAIFRRNGWNVGRLRLFVAPNHQNAVVNDLPYTLALAKRIKASGMQFLLDIHYSDTWADPGHQTKPAAWKDLPFDALVQKVHDYTAAVLAAFQKNGAPPDIVQIGNEITPGFLWPDGKLYGDNRSPEERWKRFTRLLKAGIAAARESADAPSVMIHIDKGGQPAVTKWFFTHLQKHEVDFDVIGLSYYPWWHGSMANVRKNLHDTAKTFGKDILVVETAYPYRGQDWAKKANMAWPISPEGQRAFLAELVQAVRQTPDGRGIGVVTWYPEGILVDGLKVWNGGSTALFDDEGNALPALRAVRER
ncbi:glycosyl hydrolase 53 family protein [bacterium]|nr:glycosyl hydrolase 53 family protein [bacterium]